jgi:DNA-binding MarR family transcriptional regulator
MAPPTSSSPRNQTASGDLPIDFERLAAELLRALRGKRSRAAFSRYLGYRSNVAQRWETERCWPTAAQFFAICVRSGIDVKGRAQHFLRGEPPWLEALELDTSAGVGALLTELAGRTRLVEIARRSGYNRYSVARWFKGAAEPRLPEFLHVLHVCSRRVLDFVSAWVDCSALPSVAKRWSELTLSRELAYTHPTSHAVLRALELASYDDAGPRGEQYLANRLALRPDEVSQALRRLQASGQIRRTRRGWRPRRSDVIDTGADAQRARALKLGWAKLAISRLEAGAPGYSGYSVFSISKHDLHRLRGIQLSYVREMQAVIAESEPGECVALYCAQLLDLGHADDNAFSNVA